MEKELKTTPPNRIAFSSFTRAARMEAAERASQTFQIELEDLEWFRTVHSTAYHLLGVEKDTVMDKETWKEFREQTGWNVTPDDSMKLADINVHRRHTEDDRLRYVYDYGRSKCLGIVQMLAQSPIQVNTRQFYKFVDDYEQFKHDNKLLDFTDLLTRAVSDPRVPPVSVALIDEAQDLSPLQIACVEHWYGEVDRLYIAGDDDQAIYGFQGANPQWLIEQYAQHDSTILSQSYRIPRLVHRIAQRIIQKNHNRIAKDYEPKTDEGEVLDCVEDLDDWDQQTLVLCRNRMFFKRVAERLEGYGIAFDVEGQGYHANYDKQTHLTALRCILGLHRFGSWPKKDFRKVLNLIPAASGILPRGIKSKYQKGRAKGRVSKSELVMDGLSKFLQMSEKDPAAPLLKITPSERAYWSAVMTRYGKIPSPTVTISTIHGAKGREADNVLVVPDLTKACDNAARHPLLSEGENRVAYVAVTRAKKRLGVLKTNSRKRYNYSA